MAAERAAPERKRLNRENRHEQLLDVAREMIRSQGTESFTLARLAEAAGVTKPVAYDHFGDRSRVFVELYLAFEKRRLETLDEALDDVSPTLSDVAEVVAAAYIDCYVIEGRELSDVIAALSGSPELDAIRRRTVEEYLIRCREALTPFAGTLGEASLWAIVGAGDGLGRAVTERQIRAADACRVLTRVVTAVAAPTAGIEQETADIDKEKDT
ncbi:TetR/AcrR family transcriptional regulator [Brevibacterium sediminis]|nr:TetR/AcrR family transcriptional regulator [Brevibacterium sediminis]TNM51578.1 TetR/AcrR family transcriptional regulator [Brevibacterium sediminis]